MLIEGFYGNTLVDVEFNICNLSVRFIPTQPKQMTCRLTSPQVYSSRAYDTPVDKSPSRASYFAYPQTGSISSTTPTGEPIIDKLATAPLAGLASSGPFSTAEQHFSVVGQAAVKRFDDNINDTPISFSLE